LTRWFLTLFVGPIEVVCAWVDMEETFHAVLNPSPKMNLLQGPIQPSRRDAKIGFMWSHVVNAVVFLWKDEMQGLETGDQGRKPMVRVRPLVNLTL